MHQILKEVPMDIKKHIINTGIYAGKTIDEIEDVRDQIEFLNWYTLQLNDLELIKELTDYLKSLLFNKKMDALNTIIGSFYDEKMKNKQKDVFYITYLDYLALKHTGKTIEEIKNENNIAAIERIINQITNSTTGA